MAMAPEAALQEEEKEQAKTPFGEMFNEFKGDERRLKEIKRDERMFLKTEGPSDSQCFSCFQCFLASSFFREAKIQKAKSKAKTGGRSLKRSASGPPGREKTKTQRAQSAPAGRGTKRAAEADRSSSYHIIDSIMLYDIMLYDIKFYIILSFILYTIM